MQVVDTGWLDEVTELTLNTPQSDALSQMGDMTHQYYDPDSPEPLPLQIVKATRDITARESSEQEEARTRAKQKLSLKLSAAKQLSLVERMILSLDTYIPQDQKTRYGQVDMYKDEGDIDACLSGIVNASAVESVYCIHPDEKVAQTVNDIFEVSDMSTTMKEIASCYEYYGNAFPSQVWNEDREYVGTIVLNPKNVAVSRSTGLNMTNLAYRPPTEFVETVKQVQRQDMWYWTREDGWEDFFEMGFNAIPLRKDTTCHIKSGYLGFQRYGVPRISKAARQISVRNLMEEMRRSTIEGVKNQMIFLTLENPTPKEIEKLNNLVKSNKKERITMAAWRDNLKAVQVLPGAIDQLLAPRTWEQINISVFRNLNIPIHVTGDTNGEDVDPEVVKQALMMLLMQAADIQHKIRRRFLAQWTNMFNGSRRISKKNALRPSHFMFVPTAIDASHRIEKIIQPLATFGLISRQTAGVWAGLRWDRELQQIIREVDEGITEYTRPFSSFSQETSNGPGAGSRTESISKPGRTPDNANPNRAGQPKRKQEEDRNG